MAPFISLSGSGEAAGSLISLEHNYDYQHVTQWQTTTLNLFKNATLELNYHSQVSRW